MSIKVFIAKESADFDPLKAASSLPELGLGLISQGELQGVRGALFEGVAAGDLKELKASANEGALGFDLMISERGFPVLGKTGAVVLDMDMTSVQIEGIDEIARRVGVYDKVAEITSQAMHGGLDFATSLTRRVSMLKDGDAAVIEDVKKIMRETDGLDALMQTATSHNWKKGICSGGFVQLICVLEQKYGLDMVRANSLEVRDGKLTGRVDRAIVDAEAKRRGVLDLMQEHGISKAQTVVLGDGANDLKMIFEAGMGIAYHAKPLVRAQAPFALNHSSLAAVALLLKLNS